MYLIKINRPYICHVHLLCLFIAYSNDTNFLILRLRIRLNSQLVPKYQTRTCLWSSWQTLECSFCCSEAEPESLISTVLGGNETSVQYCVAVSFLLGSRVLRWRAEQQWSFQYLEKLFCRFKTISVIHNRKQTFISKCSFLQRCNFDNIA